MKMMSEELISGGYYTVPEDVVYDEFSACGSIDTSKPVVFITSSGLSRPNETVAVLYTMTDGDGCVGYVLPHYLTKSEDLDVYNLEEFEDLVKYEKHYLLDKVFHVHDELIDSVNAFIERNESLNFDK